MNYQRRHEYWSSLIYLQTKMHEVTPHSTFPLTTETNSPECSRCAQLQEQLLPGCENARPPCRQTPFHLASETVNLPLHPSVMDDLSTNRSEGWLGLHLSHHQRVGTTRYRVLYKGTHLLNSASPLQINGSTLKTHTASDCACT